MQHRCEQLHVQRGVAETLLEPVTLVVSPLGVNFGLAKFLLGGGEVSEPGEEGTVDVDLVGHNNEYGRDSGNPLKGAEAVL